MLQRRLQGLAGPQGGDGEDHEVSPRSNVARTYCTRAFNGIASGRITYEDFRTKSPRFIRVIQGR